MHNVKRILAAWGVLGTTGSAAAAPRSGAILVVHEWGTFASFQDADGTTIAGINVDDEPFSP